MNPTNPARPESKYLPVADIDVDAVRTVADGFLLEGRGADRTEYRVSMRLEVPVDARTRNVLAELLSQSSWRVSRRAPEVGGRKRALGVRSPSARSDSAK